MPTIGSRLTANGVLYTSGQFDEVSLALQTVWSNNWVVPAITTIYDRPETTIGFYNYRVPDNTRYVTVVCIGGGGGGGGGNGGGGGAGGLAWMIDYPVNAGQNFTVVVGPGGAGGSSAGGNGTGAVTYGRTYFRVSSFAGLGGGGGAGGSNATGSPGGGGGAAGVFGNGGTANTNFVDAKLALGGTSGSSITSGGAAARVTGNYFGGEGGMSVNTIAGNWSQGTNGAGGGGGGGIGRSFGTQAFNGGGTGFTVANNSLYPVTNDPVIITNGIGANYVTLTGATSGSGGINPDNSSIGGSAGFWGGGGAGGASGYAGCPGANGAVLIKAYSAPVLSNTIVSQSYVPVQKVMHTPQGVFAAFFDEVTGNLNPLGNQDYGIVGPANTPPAPPPPASLTFSAGTFRTMSGYAPNGRAGWTLNNAIAPGSYDDGFAGPFSNIMPSGKVWYMNNTAYNNYYVGSNGQLTFGAGDGNILSAPAASPAGFWFCPGDNYWGTNGTNGSGNTPNGFAYKFGTTSTGFNFFSANLMAYTYGNSGIDKGWELNCFWNDDNSKQWVEFIWSPAFGSYSGSFGVSIGGSVAVQVATLGGSYPAANKSYCFSSFNKGVTWNNDGSGSWSGTGTF